MATHTNETGENLIIFRIIFRKERRDLFTGIYRIKADWDSNSGLVLKPNKACKTITDNLTPDPSEAPRLSTNLSSQESLKKTSRIVFVD